MLHELKASPLHNSVSTFSLNKVLKVYRLAVLLQTDMYSQCCSNLLTSTMNHVQQASFSATTKMNLQEKKSTLLNCECMLRMQIFKKWIKECSENRQKFKYFECVLLMVHNFSWYFAFKMAGW
jgi:hypothetical protein